MTVSPGKLVRAFAPWSTLMPGMMPSAARCCGNGTPARVFWRSVSSYMITPLMASAMPGAENSISR